MERPPRDNFPNAYVGDLVETPTGWAVVAPLYCPNWHRIDEPGGNHRSLACDCGKRHYTWTCHCGGTIYAPKLGPSCRILLGGEGLVPPSVGQQDT